MHSRIEWHQIYVANLGQKQEPGSVVSLPFWSYHKLPPHVGERGQWGCCFTTTPPPVCHTHTHRSVSFVFSVLWVVGHCVRVECRLVSLVSGVCGSRGLSCSLRLLTGPARVWSPPFSSVFSLWGLCLRAVLRTWPAQSRSVKETARVLWGFGTDQQTWFVLGLMLTAVHMKSC